MVLPFGCASVKEFFSSSIETFPVSDSLFFENLFDFLSEEFDVNGEINVLTL